MVERLPARLAEHPTVLKVRSRKRRKPGALEEFMGGFTGWAQTIAERADAADFRSRVSDSENASMWQSLSFKPNHKAAYCLAVCPAGEDVIEPYLDDRKSFVDLVLKPLQDKKETLYVLPNSRAKAHAERRYPHKPVKVVDSGIRGR